MKPAESTWSHLCECSISCPAANRHYNGSVCLWPRQARRSLSVPLLIHTSSQLETFTLRCSEEISQRQYINLQRAQGLQPAFPKAVAVMCI